MSIKFDQYLMKNELNLCPEPTITFNVDDHVFIGNLIDPVIVDTYADNKFYLVKYTTNERYGGGPQEKKSWFPWYSIRSSNPKVESVIAADEDLRLDYSQRDVGGLLTVVYHFGCDMSPSYQRELVWTLEDKQALIDAIFHGVDIGKFVFVKLPYSSQSAFGYEILDGKQRLNAITEFYEGRFEYKGKKFRELNVRDQSFFKHYNISYGELDCPTDEQKLRTFILLNTRGKILDDSQIQHAKDLYKEVTGVEFDW